MTGHLSPQCARVTGLLLSSLSRTTGASLRFRHVSTNGPVVNSPTLRQQHEDPLSRRFGLPASALLWSAVMDGLSKASKSGAYAAPDE